MGFVAWLVWLLKLELTVILQFARLIVEKSLAEAIEGVEYALANSLSFAMNQSNRREKPKKKSAEDNVESS